MEPSENGNLDHRIREAFTPDAEAVRRIAGRALASKAPRPRRIVPILAAIAICTAVWLAHLRRPAESPDTLTLDCFGEVAVVQTPDGAAWIFSEGGQEPGPNVELGFIFYEGELP